MTDNDKNTWHDKLPFPRHWLGYVALKAIALVLVIYLVLRWKGLL